MKIKEKKLKKAVKKFYKLMKKRLAEKESEGYEGWGNEEFFSNIKSGLLKDIEVIQEFKDLDMQAFYRTVSDNLFIDIANRSMMLDCMIKKLEKK